MGLVKLWHIHSYNGDMVSLVSKEGNDKMEYIGRALIFLNKRAISRKIHRIPVTFVATRKGNCEGMELGGGNFSVETLFLLSF